MKGRAVTTPTLSWWDMREWLVGQVADILQVPRSEVSPRAPFTDLGLSSVQAVELAAALEDWTGHEIPATIVYECPTIEDAAEYVLGLAT
jgi:acyl carrier protein